MCMKCVNVLLLNVICVLISAFFYVTNEWLLCVYLEINVLVILNWYLTTINGIANYGFLVGRLPYASSRDVSGESVFLLLCVYL
jgi:hypothetical protein